MQPDRARRIVVGVELGMSGARLEPASLCAVTRAGELARHSGASICLVHSTDDEEHYRSEEGRIWEQRPGISPEGARALESCRADLSRDGVRAEVELSTDPPWLAIACSAQKHHADLVLVGKRESPRFDFDDRMLGSVAFKLLRECPGTIWAVAPGRPDAPRRILVAAPADQRMTARLLSTGAGLARAFGAEVHVFHAPHPAWLENLVAATAIANRAAELDADLVVVGATRSALRSVVLGHTAERLFGLLDTSILALKPAGFTARVAVAAA